MEEETIFSGDYVDYQSLPICTCVCGDTVSAASAASEEIQIPERKQYILNTVTRTESYLRERRIPELIRFLLTMILAHTPDKPVVFLEKLLDNCMLFRAGHGVAPVIYENRHLEAAVKSFDPGQRGWLSSGQIHRLYTTLGLNPDESIEERVSCDVVLNNLKKTQELELFQLLAASIVTDNKSDDLKFENFTSTQ